MWKWWNWAISGCRIWRRQDTSVGERARCYLDLDPHYCTLLHTTAHCFTLLHTAARALVRTVPHFCQQTAYSFPSGAEGNLRGAIRCEQEPPKCAKKYFQVKWSNIKKLCHVLALNYLSFGGVTIILCWLKEGGIEYGGMIGWTSLGLSITSPRVSPELLQTHFFLQYDQ